MAWLWALVGVFVGYKTKDTRFGRAAGSGIWLALAALFAGSAIVGFVQEPTATAVFSCGFLLFLAWCCLRVALRPARHAAPVERPSGITVLQQHPDGTWR